MERLNLGYEPFGSLLPGRNYSSDSYRFGFQGQEKDDEIQGATGTSYAYEYRMHDPRVGRFLSIDPLTSKYPQWSPYVFSGNQVIASRELEGLEPDVDRNKPKASEPSMLTYFLYGLGSAGKFLNENPINVVLNGPPPQDPMATENIMAGANGILTSVLAVDEIINAGRGIAGGRNNNNSTTRGSDDIPIMLQKVSTAVQKVDAKDVVQTVRVGRWMSPIEFKAMNSTGQVQSPRCR